MLPVMLRIGPVAVYSYGVMLALAFLACWLVARWYLPRRGLHPEVALDLVLAAAIGGIVGARALFVGSDWGTYAAHPLWIFMLQRGGMVFYGGLLGGAAGVAIYTWVRRLPFAAVADTAAIAVPLGSAIGRLGCFLNGCCAGHATSAWYGVVFPYLGRVFPSQLLDSAVNLAIFAALLALAVLRPPRPGVLWWTFLVAYPVARFLVEMTRVNPAGRFGLTQAQAISVPLLLAGLAGLAFTLARGRVSARRAPAPGEHT